MVLSKGKAKTRDPLPYLEGCDISNDSILGSKLDKHLEAKILVSSKRGVEKGKAKTKLMCQWGSGHCGRFWKSVLQREY